MTELDHYEEHFPAVQDSNEIAEFLKKHHHEVSKKVSKLALARENQSLLRRLFPTDLDKVFADAKVQAATTELSFRHAALELSAKSKMEAVEEQCQVMVRMVKSHHRAEFAKFVTEAYLRLSEDVDQKTKRHLEGSRKRYETYEEFKDLPVGATYMKHITAADDKFFRWLEKLLENFRSIADEKVRQYRL